MQRIMNAADDFVDECLNGFIKVHSSKLKIAGNPRVVATKLAPVSGKVGVISGGGSGHEPAFIGFVGENMLDAVAVGEVFSSPTAKCFFDAIRAADGGRGVVCLYGNYAGDNMNLGLALELAEKAGIEVLRVVANDDICSAPLNEREKRRGVAGEIFMWQVASAKATSGGSLKEVARVAQKAIDSCRSIGVGLAPCTLPSMEQPNFLIEPDKMEVGIGHHGEPGLRVAPILPARELVKEMLETIDAELQIGTGGEVAVLLSGLGATPVSELYVAYDAIESLLSEQGTKIFTAHVGNYFTSLDMKGATLTLMKLDEELKALLGKEIHCTA